MTRHHLSTLDALQPNPNAGELADAVAYLVYHRRRRMGLSALAVAERMGITAASYWRFEEQGRVKGTGLDALTRVCDALGLSIIALLAMAARLATRDRDLLPQLLHDFNEWQQAGIAKRLAKHRRRRKIPS